MSVRLFYTPSFSFRSLVVLWLFFFSLAALSALVFAPRAAQADIYLPLPKAQKSYQPAVLRSFTPSPSPTLVETQCGTLRHSLHESAHDVSLSSFDSRTQRNAGQEATRTIEAIRAYRQCVSALVLNQLAER